MDFNMIYTIIDNIKLPLINLDDLYRISFPNKSIDTIKSSIYRFFKNNKDMLPSNVKSVRGMLVYLYLKNNNEYSDIDLFIHQLDIDMDNKGYFYLRYVLSNYKLTSIKNLLSEASTHFNRSTQDIYMSIYNISNKNLSIMLNEYCDFAGLSPLSSLFSKVDKVTLPLCNFRTFFSDNEYRIIYNYYNSIKLSCKGLFYIDYLKSRKLYTRADKYLKRVNINANTKSYFYLKYILDNVGLYRDLSNEDIIERLSKHFSSTAYNIKSNIKKHLNCSIKQFIVEYGGHLC